MLAYLEMMRPLNALMSAIAVFIGGFIVLGLNASYFFAFSPIYFAMIVVFLVTGAGNVINDVLDIHSDKVNRPRRPIPSGRASKKGAIAFSVALFAAGIVLSGFINWVCFIIAIFNSALLIVYSAVLQNKILLGNIAVSYLVGSTFLFGGAAALNLRLPLLLMLLASLANISREVIKDIEDIEGDRLGFLKDLAHNVKSAVVSRFGTGPGGDVSIRYRRQTVINTAIASMTCAIIVSPLPFLLGILGWLYLILVIPTDIIFVSSIYMMTKAKKKKHYSWISKLIKAGMLLGLIAFIAGVIF